MNRKAQRNLARVAWRHLPAGLVCLLMLPGALRGGAPAQPTAEDWDLALTAVRQMALDPAQPAERRADAVIACAKLQMLRGDPAAALTACQEVFTKANDKAVAEAAVRAACLVQRQVHGHLGGARDLIETWKASVPGPFKNALDVVNADLARFASHLMEMAGRKLPPPPVPVGRPGWMPGRPGGGAINFAGPLADPPPWTRVEPNVGPPPLRVAPPAIPVPPWLAPKPPEYSPALRVTLPTYTAPDWYRAVTFQPIPPPPPKPGAAGK